MTTPGASGRPLLVIGNRNYSSWSLRAWFFLRQSGIDFETLRLPLDTSEFEERIGEFSPTRRVPVFIHGSTRVWDSLAICEYAGEAFAGVQAWPGSLTDRATARSIACEMHAGFAALRAELPMNCRARNRSVTPSREADDDIMRIVSLWEECLAESGGPWLFGEFSVADAMYAPVVCRFVSYEIPLPRVAREWQVHLLRQPAMNEWLTDAGRETEVIEADEAGGDS